MNHEVEREVGELAKLRLFKERVMALRDEWRLPEGTPYRLDYARGRDHCAADIDEALKECQ